MPITMTSNLMGCFIDLPHHPRVGFCNLANNEERGVDPQRVEESQHAIYAFFDTGGKITALLLRNSRFEFQTVIVFFNIDAHRVRKHFLSSELVRPGVVVEKIKNLSTPRKILQG